MNDILSLMARLNARIRYRQFHDSTTSGQVQAPRYAAPLKQSELEEEPLPAPAQLYLVQTAVAEAAVPAEPEIFFIKPRSDGRIIEPPREVRALEVQAPALPPAPVAEPMATVELAISMREPPRMSHERGSVRLPLRKPAQPLPSSRALQDIFTRLQRKPS